MAEKILTTYTKWGIAAATALFSIFLFYLNSIYPYFPGDDAVFQLIIPEDGIIGTERIKSLGDLLESQYNFYFNYHYRILNHFILQGLLALPPVVFDILNVLVFLLLPICILKISRLKDDPQYWIKYFFLLMFIWVFHLNLGWAYFPATGALNYTWYLIPQLLYLAMLLKYNEGEQVNKGQLLMLAGVNALGNENACIMLSLLTGLIILLNWKRKDKFLLLAFGLIIVGGVFMLASPSIGKRLETQGHLSAGLAAHLIEFSKRTIYYMLRYMSVFLVLLVSKKRASILSQKSVLIIISFLAATFSMVLAPLFEPRSAVLGFFVLLVLMASLVDTKWKIWPLYLITAVAILLCITRAPEFKKQYDRHQINERILEQNRGSQERVYLERYCDHSTRDYLLCHENSVDPNAFDNRSVAAVYGIKEVVLAEKFFQQKRRKKMFSSLEQNRTLLTDYKKLDFEDGTALYYNVEEGGMDLFVEAQTDMEPFYILRGSPSGVSKHRIIDLFPQKIRLYFLDYMEGINHRSQQVLHKQGSSYNYFYITDYHRYNYILISKYAFDQHSPIGDIYPLELK